MGDGERVEELSDSGLSSPATDMSGSVQNKLPHILGTAETLRFGIDGPGDKPKDASPKRSPSLVVRVPKARAKSSSSKGPGPSESSGPVGATPPNRKPKGKKTKAKAKAKGKDQDAKKAGSQWFGETGTAKPSDGSGPPRKSKKRKSAAKKKPASKDRGRAGCFTSGSRPAVGLQVFQKWFPVRGGVSDIFFKNGSKSFKSGLKACFKSQVQDLQVLDLHWDLGFPE